MDMKNTIYLLAFTILVITCSCKPTPKEETPPYHNPNYIGGYHVIIDQSKEQLYSPFDFGFSGMSRFGNLLQRHKVLVTLNSLPLEKFLPTLKTQGTLLFLGVAMYAKYTSQEISAIKSFVHRGGAVTIIGEHDNYFDNGTFQNKLTKEFGVKIRFDQALGKRTSFKDHYWPECVAKIFNMDNIYLYVPVSLALSKNAQPLIKLKNPLIREKAIVASVTKHGKGKVIVLGDAEIFWNMTKESGIRKAQNQKLLLTLFSYATQFKQSAEVISKQETLKSPTTSIVKKKSKKFISILNAPHGLSPLNSSFGFSKFYSYFNKKGYYFKSKKTSPRVIEKSDLVILAVPTVKIKNIRLLRKSKKLLLISDGVTNITRDAPDIISVMKKFFKIQVEIHEYTNPLNMLMGEYNIKFLDATVISTNRNRLFAYTENNFSLFRSTAIISTQRTFSKDMSILLQTKKGLIISENYTPKIRKGKPLRNVFPQSRYIKARPSFPIIVKNKRIFAIADMELLSDYNFGKSNNALGEKILSWLKE